LHALNTESDGFKFGYEPDVAAVIDCFVGNTGSLIDVGANFGYFSIYLASRKGFCGMAHAFEPSARSLSDLNQLVVGFELKDRIGIYPYALGDTAGSANIFLSNSDGLTTLVASMANRIEKVVREETVEVRRLDDFKFGQVDLIKIDVEGAEALVIAGGIDTIETHSPVVVFESWSSVDDSGAFSNLHRRGYHFFVPTWLNAQRQHSVSIADAVEPSNVVLIMFQHAERNRLPERINVVAIPEPRLRELSTGKTIC
jgi:FkbM family methyltransferase